MGIVRYQFRDTEKCHKVPHNRRFLLWAMIGAEQKEIDWKSSSHPIMHSLSTSYCLPVSKIFNFLESWF
jgi:hypothetical protein